MAYKVFTNGSTLQASEVNENLMQQSVATFSNSAARTAAITSPVEGQLTYLLDVDRYEHWTGSSWVSPFGLTFLSSTSFTTATVVTIDNLFTTTYDNYVLYIDLTSSANVGINGQFRKAGVPTTTAYYLALDGINSGGTASGNTGTNNSNFQIAVGVPSYRSTSRVEIMNPKNSVNTSSQISLTFFDGTNLVSRMGHSFQNSTTDFDGISFTPTSGTITGKISGYGLRK